jgi:hypothetical protein
MNKIFKQVLIISSVFIVIYWFQQKDDKKSKRVRTTFIEKYKLPLLVSSIIGFILNFKLLSSLNNNDTITEVTIVTPVAQCGSNKSGLTSVKDYKNLNEMSKPFVNSNNFGSKTNELTWFSKNPTDQQIYTDLPDF